MVNVLTEKLKGPKGSVGAEKATEVEAAINDLHPFESDKESYAATARTMCFNLKKNDALRRQLLSGNLSPTDLVRMTPEQLASSEKALRDEKDRENAPVSRGDLDQILANDYGCEPTKPPAMEAFRDY